MSSPLLFPGLIIAWSLSFYATPKAIPFAIGLTILWTVDVLFATPTIPTGKLPPSMEIYYRAFFRCFKQRQLQDSNNDVIPVISSDATHLLYSLESLWSYDTLITPNIINNTEKDNKICEYITHTPLERSEYRDKQIKVRTDHALNDGLTYSSDFFETITKSMKLLYTIPLSLHPAYYLLPAMTLDASIQTFVHFPLTFWNAQYTMTDMTIFFSVPRGAQFFVNSTIIGLRRGIKRVYKDDKVVFEDNDDLLVDIQTQIMVDKNRIARGYDMEEKEEENLQKQLDEVNEKLSLRKNVLLQEGSANYDEDEVIRELQEEHASLLIRQRTIEEYKEHNEELQRQKHLPAVLVLVANIVNTYTYKNAIGKQYNLLSQDQFPHHWIPRGLSYHSDVSLKSYELLIKTYLQTSTIDKQLKPQLEVNVDKELSTKYAKLCDNYHPCHYNGIIPNVLGIPAQHQNQLDLSFSVYTALSVYHAMKQDNLSYGQSHANTILQKHDQLANKNATQTESDENESISEKEEKSSDKSIDFIYPYRCIFSLCETLTAPATINTYIDDDTPALTDVPHRGYTYLQFKKEQTQKKQKIALQQQSKKTDNTEALSSNNSKDDNDEDEEMFPQFSKQNHVKITVPDGDEQIVWVEGIILHTPQ